MQLGAIRVEPPIVLAPMAGVSEAPYRAIAKAHGAGLCPTELVSANGLVYRNARTESYLKHDPAKEPALAVQIFGGEPEAMAEAAVIAEARGARIIDINMGCPVKKVTRNGAGAALLEDPLRAAQIVEAVARAVSIPVTVKLRSGWQKGRPVAVRLGPDLASAGAQALTLHPRSREEGYSGSADHDLTAELVRAVSIPVIANGDLFSVADAEAVLRDTGAAAVMIGRAALGNPWIFESLRAAWRGEALPGAPSPEQRAATILEHFEAHLAHHEDAVSAIRRFRQHLIWYSRGMKEASTFRNAVMRLREVHAIEDAIDRFFSSRPGPVAGVPEMLDDRQAAG